MTDSRYCNSTQISKTSRPGVYFFLLPGKEVVRKVMFSQASICSQLKEAIRVLRDTVNKWAVRILRECILVCHKIHTYFYRPRSEASEGYIFTGICLSNSGGGGEGRVDQGPGHNISALPPRGLCAGGRYASYWNAFLFVLFFSRLFLSQRRKITVRAGKQVYCSSVVKPLYT